MARSATRPPKPALPSAEERKTAVRERIEELELAGQAFDRAKALGVEEERAAVVRYLASDALLQRWRDSVGGSRLHEIAIEAIKAGAHRPDEQSMNEPGFPRSSKATDAGAEAPTEPEASPEYKAEHKAERKAERKAEKAIEKLLPN